MYKGLKMLLTISQNLYQKDFNTVYITGLKKYDYWKINEPRFIMELSIIQKYTKQLTLDLKIAKTLQETEALVLVSSEGGNDFYVEKGNEVLGILGFSETSDLYTDFNTFVTKERIIKKLNVLLTKKDLEHIVSKQRYLNGYTPNYLDLVFLDLIEPITDYNLDNELYTKPFINYYNFNDYYDFIKDDYYRLEREKATELMLNNFYYDCFNYRNSFDIYKKG